MSSCCHLRWENQGRRKPESDPREGALWTGNSKATNPENGVPGGGPVGKEGSSQEDANLVLPKAVRRESAKPSAGIPSCGHVPCWAPEACPSQPLLLRRLCSLLRMLGGNKHASLPLGDRLSRKGEQRTQRCLFFLWARTSVHQPRQDRQQSKYLSSAWPVSTKAVIHRLPWKQAG